MTVEEEPVQGLSHGRGHCGQRMRWIFGETVPKMPWDQMGKGLNQGLEPAGCATSGKLWSLTEPQFPCLLSGSKYGLRLSGSLGGM